MKLPSIIFNVITTSIMVTVCFLLIKEVKELQDKNLQYESLHRPEKNMYYRIANHPVDMGGEESKFFFVTQMAFEGQTFVDIEIMRQVEVPDVYRLYPNIYTKPQLPISCIGGPDLPKYLVVTNVNGMEMTVFLNSKEELSEFQSKLNH